MADATPPLPRGMPYFFYIHADIRYLRLIRLFHYAIDKSRRLRWAMPLLPQLIRHWCLRWLHCCRWPRFTLPPDTGIAGQRLSLMPCWHWYLRCYWILILPWGFLHWSLATIIYGHYAIDILPLALRRIYTIIYRFSFFLLRFLR